ncbi:hypothetical protein [Methylophaga sp. UBA1464]|uniref:hypothetical protein n=1 Tax=Methylophaga sp. UBA1464 TaxID=1946866 RepID=UPI0025CCBFED|nr:hypothetical protein [Methylophaga sp. UBA1464]
MAERVNAAKRIELTHVAEREIMRFADDHALWHKHVHNVELDAAQVLKCIEMDQYANTIDYSCRRTGKTAVKELHNLKYIATHADQELGIVAPREAQSIINLNYHLDAIRRSQILDNYLMFKSGRKQMSDTKFQLANRSVAQAYGIMAQIDGADMTVGSIEEVDDCPADRLNSRFLLTMGATRRLGASKDSVNEPKIRITGVLKGADTLSDLIAAGHYHVLTIINAYLGIEMGILNESFIMQMRSQLAPDEYLRQLLCKNVTARNLIWEKHIRRALTVGLAANLQHAEPLPGIKRKKNGLLAFGYDAGGHGEDPHSSKHALVVVEQIGNFVTFPFVKTWPAGADDNVVKRDLIGLWRYFDPDYAIGDAYGVGMLTQLNDELYGEGLTDIDRRSIGDGDSTASTWSHWPFAPLRFEGMTKHAMAQQLRSVFHNNQAAIPYFDDMNVPAELLDMQDFIRQLPNIVPVKTKTSYASYKRANSKLGDDLFDAAMAGVWAITTRGATDVKTVIATRTQSYDQLLGNMPHAIVMN